MAAQILTRHTKKRIQIANGAVTRVLPFYDNWTQLRVGIWFSIMGSTNASTPRLVVGVCNPSPAPYPGDCHLLGLQTNSTTWTAGTTNHTGFSTTGVGGRHRYVQKIGSVESHGLDSNNAVTGYCYGGNTLSNNHAFLAVEFNRATASTIQVREYGTSVTTSTRTVTLEVITAQMYAALNSVSITGHAYVRAAETFSVNELSDGPLSHLVAAFDQTDPVLELLGVFSIRLS